MILRKSTLPPTRKLWYFGSFLGGFFISNFDFYVYKSFFFFSLFYRVTVEAIQRQAIRERIEADSSRPLIRERAELLRRIRHLQRLVRLHDHVFNE